MINADEARYKTKYAARLNEIMNGIDSAIHKAIDKGLYTCDYAIPTYEKQVVRDEVKKLLKALGYKVVVPKTAFIRLGPIEEGQYANYEYITVSWEDTEDKAT